MRVFSLLCDGNLLSSHHSLSDLCISLFVSPHVEHYFAMFVLVPEHHVDRTLATLECITLSQDDAVRYYSIGVILAIILAN